MHLHEYGQFTSFPASSSRQQSSLLPSNPTPVMNRTHVHHAPLQIQYPTAGTKHYHFCRVGINLKLLISYCSVPPAICETTLLLARELKRRCCATILPKQSSYQNMRGIGGLNWGQVRIATWDTPSTVCIQTSNILYDLLVRLLGTTAQTSHAFVCS